MKPRPVPLAVNFHLYPRCNLHCTFCYAGFPDTRTHLPLAQAKDVIDRLAAAGTDKITFVGGEPTLHPHLAELVRHAASLGLVTCVVTNGARLRQVLDDAGDALHWVGLSIDSGLEDVQAALGRDKGNHIAKSIEHADELRRRGIRIKLNSVITSLNCQEDMSALVRRIGPDRWKIFQVLRIEGENEDKVEPLLITEEQFKAFVLRHEHLAAEGLAPVAEDNDAMRGSYIMIDPQGRFFTNENGRYVVSKPIVDVGVEAALAEVRWRQDKFIARGGVYSWRDNSPSSPIVAIEGLDGCGKSTTVRLVAERLGARIIRNPPVELASERAVADILPADERRAWYLKANRMAMEQALSTKDKAVVLDRSIASTLAFGAAERGDVAHRDDLPSGFPLPDIIVLLNLPEEMRRARHAGRRGEVTTEEERLSTDHAFRARVLNGYANLCTVKVDASGMPEAVVDAVCKAVSTWMNSPARAARHARPLIVVEN